LGLVQSAPCRIDIEFRDALGKQYKKTATVKIKGTDTEELPLYSNKDDLIGEVIFQCTTSSCMDGFNVR
jgi:hypothetical protein